MTTEMHVHHNLPLAYRAIFWDVAGLPIHDIHTYIHTYIIALLPSRKSFVYINHCNKTEIFVSVLLVTKMLGE
jgi:hypothetical protein